jgi:hypothetical protein
VNRLRLKQAAATERFGCRLGAQQATRLPYDLFVPAADAANHQL